MAAQVLGRGVGFASTADFNGVLGVVAGGIVRWIVTLGVINEQRHARGVGWRVLGDFLAVRLRPFGVTSPAT